MDTLFEPLEPRPRRTGRPSLPAAAPARQRCKEAPARPDGRRGAYARGPPAGGAHAPAHLEEFVGQAHLLGEGSALRTAIERGNPHSMVLYGPPGSGKTTLARMVAERSGRRSRS